MFTRNGARGFALSSAGLIVCVVAATLAAPARADGSSLFTIGVGGGVGVSSVLGAGGSAERSFVNQANVRLKMLGLGLDYSYDLQRDASLTEVAEDLQYRAKMRLTALVYPYSGDTVALYLGVGVGGTSLAELTELAAKGNSYHGGLGLEWHVAEHFTIDVSFMLVAPGVASIKRSLVAETTAAIERAGSATMTTHRTPGLGEFLSLDNHEAMIRILLFL